MHMQVLWALQDSDDGNCIPNLTDQKRYRSKSCHADIFAVVKLLSDFDSMSEALVESITKKLSMDGGIKAMCPILATAWEASHSLLPLMHPSQLMLYMHALGWVNPAAGKCW